MQLVQIGEARQKTVLEMIQEIADRQFEEIERLKLAAQLRHLAKATTRSRVVRCNPRVSGVLSDK